MLPCLHAASCPNDQPVPLEDHACPTMPMLMCHSLCFPYVSLRLEDLELGHGCSAKQLNARRKNQIRQRHVRLIRPVWISQVGALTCSLSSSGPKEAAGGAIPRCRHSAGDAGRRIDTTCPSRISTILPDTGLLMMPQTGCSCLQASQYDCPSCHQAAWRGFPCSLTLCHSTNSMCMFTDSPIAMKHQLPWQLLHRDAWLS